MMLVYARLFVGPGQENCHRAKKLPDRRFVLDADGSADVLWKESGAGVVWAVIRENAQ